MGALGRRPELLRRRRCSHTRRRAPDGSPPNAYTHFLVEDGLHVYLSGANGPGAELPPRAAPPPVPPLHPAPPLSAHVPPINQSLLRAHVTRRAELESAGHVTWAAGPPGACSPAACAVLRRHLPYGGASPHSAVRRTIL